MPSVKTSCQAKGLKNQLPGSGQLGSASPRIRAVAYIASEAPSASQGLTRAIANASRRPEKKHDIQRENIEVAELLSEHENAEAGLQRLMEDEASPIRLDQARGATDEVTYRGDRDRRAGQADMDAVDVVCAPKAPS